MPRIADPGNAAGTAATREWRKRVKAQRRPETDAVDTALAAAVAVYRYSAETSRSPRDVTKVTALEIMAINYLVANGYAYEQAERQVRRRVRRLDVGDILPLVNGRTRVKTSHQAPTSP